MTIDLRSIPVGSVVWCTGYTDDFSWLPPALVNAEGRPQHRDGAAPLPGVWYVGLRYSPTAPPGTSSGSPPTRPPPPTPWLPTSRKPPARHGDNSAVTSCGTSVGLTSRFTAEPSMASPPGGDAGTALPGHHRRHRQPHRRRHRAGRLPARRLPDPALAGAGAGIQAAAPDQPHRPPTTAGVQVLTPRVVRTPPDERRLASAVVGPEQRYCALAPTFGPPSLRPLHRQQREQPLSRQIPHRGLSGTSRSRTLAWIAVRQIRSLVLRSTVSS